MIEIKDREGNVILSLNPSSGSVRKCELMKEDYILIKFTLAEPMDFPLGCYVDGEFGLFELIKNQKPTYNKNTGGYDYELQFDAHYWKWNNKIFKFSPESGSRESSWSLTSSLDIHLSIVLRNLTALGYTYRGIEYTFNIDSSVENAAKVMTYDNAYILDSLFSMAKTWDCECWITDNVIHFGRCEFGDAIDFKIGDNVDEMSCSNSSSIYATRLYIFGSDKNLPSNYRTTDEQSVINGVIQKRLMLPEGIPYIDAKEGLTQDEAIESVVVFDSIYPKMDGVISVVTSYDSTVTNDDGTTTTETFYQFKDNGFTFYSNYILNGQELRVVFQSGVLNGMEFSVRFNPNGENEKLSDGSWNPDAQLWEIIANEDYGRKLPDNILKPSVGDKYVLTGWDSTKISELGLVEAAEERLLEAGRKYMAKTKIDPNTYTCKLFSDYAYNNGNQRVFELGDKVNLINDAYFKNGRESRIIGFEIQLDFPYDNPKYIVGESSSYSRLSEIEGKVETLTLKGQTYIGGNSGGVYLIRTNDKTIPSDSNAFSAKRSISTFLRKDQSDRTEHSLGVGGKLTVDGAATIGTDATIGGTATIEGDSNTVRNAHVGGSQTVGGNQTVDGDQTVGGNQTVDGASLVKGLLSLLTGAASPDFLSGYLGYGFELRKDESTGRWRLEIDELLVRMVATFFELVIHKIRHVGGSIVLSPGSMECVKVEDMGGVYRCYFKATDGKKTINNEFVVGDQARCQSFNLKQEGGITKTTFYWRLVTAVGNDWIELSKSDCANGSGVPEVGDDIVHLGNRNDTSRQNAIILDTVGSDAPSIKQYAHINSYSLIGKEVTVFSPLENRIKGRFINTAGEDINSSIIAFKKQIEEFKERNDRELTLWFYDYTPTLENAPASEWSDEEKSLHLEDLFYNRAEGIAYRFTVNGSGVYSWEVITDQDTIRALEKANQAQDTADGKRRTFVSTPTDTDEYDVGDIWVNATYGELYSNDSLVCKQSKGKGEPFSITHWEASSNATTAYIQNLGDEIRQVVAENKTAGDLAIAAAKQVAEDAADAASKAQGTADEANGLATTNATAIVQGREALSLLAGKFTFDENGNVKNIDKSGLLLTADAAMLYTKKEETSELGDRVTTAEGQIKTTSETVDAFVNKVNFDEDGNVTNINKSGLLLTSDAAKLYTKQETTNALGERVITAEAKIETSVQKDANGNIESSVKISADQITMTGTVQFASPTDVSTAKSEAIDAAAQDATTKASTAQSNAEKNAAKDAADKVKALKDKLGSLAYKSSVGTSALDATIISGGKILTSLIKADELQVKSVHAENSDGTTTCHIDGETGKLTAKNADFEGKIAATSGTVGGFAIGNGVIGTELGDYTPINDKNFMSLSHSGFSTRREMFDMDTNNRPYGYKDYSHISPGSIICHQEYTGSLFPSSDACAAEFICNKYGLKVSASGIFKTSDGGKTWVAI